MIPVSFAGQNCVIAEDQPPYLPMPVHAFEDEFHEKISCWKMSLVERFIILFTGRVWLRQLTFGNHLQPVKIVTKRPFALKREGPIVFVKLKEDA